MPDPCLVRGPPFGSLGLPLSGGHRGEPPRPGHRRGAPSWPSGAPGSARPVRPVRPAPVPVPLPPRRARRHRSTRSVRPAGASPRSPGHHHGRLRRGRPPAPDRAAPRGAPTRLGHRPVLLAGLALRAVTMAVFATADRIGDLTAGQVPQDITTGIAPPRGHWVRPCWTSTAHAARSTRANRAVPGLRSGAGALLSGLVVQYLPAPAHVPPWWSGGHRCLHPPGHRGRRAAGRRTPRAGAGLPARAPERAVPMTAVMPTSASGRRETVPGVPGVPAAGGGPVVQ